MLRLILVLLAFFVIWALFFSPFNKRQRVLITLAAVFLAAIGIWYEESSDRAKTGLVASESIENCGVTASHSYRTNYDIQFCLRNKDSSATLKRLTVTVSAEQCQPGSQNGNCEIIEQVSKPLSLTLLPGQQDWFTENMAFDKVSSEQTITWKLSLDEIKAKK